MPFKAAVCNNEYKNVAEEPKKVNVEKKDRPRSGFYLFFTIPAVLAILFYVFNQVTVSVNLQPPWENSFWAFSLNIIYMTDLSPELDNLTSS